MLTSRMAREWQSGAEGSRTLDLLNAIQALSQLSYGPTRREESERRRAYSPMIATVQPNSGLPSGRTLAPARYHSRPPDSLVDSAPAGAPASYGTSRRRAL